MAVAPDKKPATAAAEGGPSGSRMAIGANVAVAIVAAAGVLVAANWISSIKHVRKEVAAIGGYGLSPRTKGVLDENTDKPIVVSVLYKSGEGDEKQQGYVDRLQDYLAEVRAYAPHVEVALVTADSQRERLVDRLSSTFGGEADKHKEVLESFNKLRTELDAELTQRLAQAQTLLSGESWLGGFPLFAGAAASLRANAESLRKTAEEIKEVTPEGGIPKYSDATSRVQTALTEVREDLTGLVRDLSLLGDLAAETGREDSSYVKMLREAADEITAIAGALAASVAEPEGGGAEPAALLKKFADQGNDAGNRLEQLVRRIDAFAQKFPMVTQHPSWSATASMSGIPMRIEVAGVLQQSSRLLRNARLQILGLLDTGNATELGMALNRIRTAVLAPMQQNASVCHDLLVGLADGLARVDEPSKQLVEEARSGALFKDRLAAITQLEEQIKTLPELKLATTADQLKEDNIVVVEADNKVRVLSFTDVFPVRESIGGPTPDAETVRTFNGDSALGTAVLTLTQRRPFGTVVLTSFEPPPPPQRNQFMPPPPESWIPSREMSALRQRIEAANFKVVDWNLATTEEAPKPEEGTENIYVLLPPPPPSQPNPFGGPPPDEKKFGDAEIAKIRDILNNDGRAVFLASWEVRNAGFFGMNRFESPAYGYGPLLSEDWGIEVRNSDRVVWVVPDARSANSFGVEATRFNYMPALGFAGDHELGTPMRGVRFLVADACPIDVASAPPPGVQTSVVLRIPDTENYIAGDVQELLHIVNSLRPESDGFVTLEPPPERGPFNAMVTAARSDGEKSRGRIAVVGFGRSLASGYLESPVPVTGAGRLQFDPPPTEGADLFVNTLLWLQGQSRWIARGPAPTPRIVPIEKAAMSGLRVLVWAIWPLAAFAPGVVLWFLRRR